MEDKKKEALEDGPHGVDRFSCNGYGLVLDGKPVEPIDKTDEIEEVEEPDKE